MGDLNYPKASKLRCGNKAVLTEALTKRIIDLSDKYKILELYPRDFTTMKHIPDEENIEFITGKRTSLENMFHLCENLISAPLFDTSKVTNMRRLFSFCDKLISVPLFNTTNVINMDGMFAHCYNLTSIPIFDIRNVKNISYMLQDNNVTSVTFKNKPANLQINSQILCGDPNRIRTIKFI